MTVAVVGLGNIGGPVAARISGAGIATIGVDGVDERRASWRAMTGAAVVADVADLPWPHVDRVVVMVRMTSQVLAVLARVRELAVSPVVCHVLSTLDAAAAREIGGESSDLVRVLEQPISGGAAGAAAGRLTVLTAGLDTPDDREFLTRTIAATVIPLPRYGQPTALKLLNNLLAAYHVRAHAQVLRLAAGAGLDPTQCQSMFDASSGASWMGGIIGDFADEQIALLSKDVQLVRSLVDPLPRIDAADDAGLLADVRAARLLVGHSH